MITSKFTATCDKCGKASSIWQIESLETAVKVWMHGDWDIKMLKEHDDSPPRIAEMGTCICPKCRLAESVV